MLGRTDANQFFLVVETQKGPSMRYLDSTFGSLLKPIDRRWFAAVVDRHDGDAYDKHFKSWDHLVTLIFAETFAMLSATADRQTRSEGTALVELIDASPIPLGKLCKWSKWNGRIRGMKLHVVYDPQADRPCCVEITPANVNDVEIGQRTPIKAGTTYVFDKGYCHFGWWRKINDDGAFFVTRAKVNMRLRAVERRPVEQSAGDGFTIINDAEVVLTSKGNARLPIPLRRIRVKRDKGGTLILITNDLTRTAVEIGALYKRRWQIELLFRWIKQHLRIRKFLGRNENAIRLQILAAMIAYVLLRIAARICRRMAFSFLPRNLRMRRCCL